MLQVWHVSHLSSYRQSIKARPGIARRCMAWIENGDAHVLLGCAMSVIGRLARGLAQALDGRWQHFRALSTGGSRSDGRGALDLGVICKLLTATRDT